MFHNYTNTYQEDNEVSDQLFELVSEEDRKKYVCKHSGCGKFFRYKSEIVRHAATHSESRPFICQYDNCYKAFKRNDALENHIRSSHTKETPFICPFPDCGMKFTTHGSFRYHVLKHNRQNPEVETPTPHRETIEDSFQPKKQVKLNSPSTSASSDPQPTQVRVEPMFKKLGMEGLSDEYYEPAPRFVNSLKWEFVNDDVEEAPKAEENQMTQLNQVLEENQVLKQKLATSEKVIKNMQSQINELLGNLFAYQRQYDNNAPAQPFLQKAMSIPNTSYEPVFQPEKEGEPMFDLGNFQEFTNITSPANYEFNPISDNKSLDSFFSFNREVSEIQTQFY